MGRILALDYGTKRIGYALSDVTGITIAKSGTLVNNKNHVTEIESMGKEYEIEKILVGFPRNMDGSLGERAHMVTAFIEKLQNRLSVDVERWDERLTSVMAESMVKDEKKSVKRNKNTIDSIAASILLNEYLQAL